MSEIEEKELAELISEAEEIGRNQVQAEDAGDEKVRAEWRQNWTRFFEPLRNGPYEEAVRHAYWEASS